MRDRGLGYQRQIDIISSLIFLVGFSEFFGKLVNLDTSDPIMGSSLLFGVGLIFFGLLAIVLNIKKDYLDLYAMVRIFIPSFLVIALVDLIDYVYIVLFEGIPFATVLTVVGVIVYLPVLTMMRLSFHIVFFMIIYFTLKYIASLSRRAKYIPYIPSLRELMTHKEQN